MESGANRCSALAMTPGADRRTEILGGIFLDCEFVMQLQASNEIIGPGGILELDAEVVDNKGKGNAVADMAEEARGTNLQVTISSQTRDEVLLEDFFREW